jgi:Domain of unknown function (DUF1830)
MLLLLETKKEHSFTFISHHPRRKNMTQILDYLNIDSERQILCGYTNNTSQIQIIRICNIPNWYFERVAFPKEMLLFEALPEAELEIHTGMSLVEKIYCSELHLD